GGAGGTTSANALTVNSTLANATAGSVTKAGGSMLILTAANTYTGNTTINEGTIKLGGTTTSTLGTISTAGNVTTIRQAGTLDLNNSGASTLLYTGGPTMNLTTVGAVAGAGSIINSSGTLSAISFG